MSENPEIGECDLDASVTPVAILVCNADDQGFDFCHCGGSSWRALSGAVVLLRAQFPIPGEQRLLHDGGDFRKDLPSKQFSLRCQGSKPFR